MALLTPQQIPVTGLNPTFGAVAASDTINPGGNLVLHVKNGNASADNCTVVIPGTTYGQANPDVVVSVPGSGGERLIAIPNGAADPATGLVTVTHSVTATVTCALYYL